MKRVYSPGSLVQGFRVTNKYTSSSAKGPDSDKVKCKAPDISSSLAKRETRPQQISKFVFKKLAIVVIIHKKCNIMPKGSIVQETIPLKVRIESQPERDRRTFSTKVLNYMKSGTMTL